MDKNNFKPPIEKKKEDQEKIDLNILDIKNSVKDEEEKGKIFVSNNQKYKKKEEIEYGKKSHMEFQRIMTENKDPIGVKSKGGLRPITIEEVSLHNSKGDLWTILNGNVYDLTMYVDYHPGGEKKLMMAAGDDCTFLFSIIQ
jgi:cytochrome b involved in lipid metabolism